MDKIFWKIITINIAVSALFGIVIYFGLHDYIGKNTSSTDTSVKTTVVLESPITKIVSDVSGAVVSIVERQPGSKSFAWVYTEREAANGTGFIVDSNGYVVTNHHVLDGNLGDYYVVFGDKTYEKVEKIYPDEANDLAVLKINKKNLPTLTLGDSDSVLVGTQVLAIGNAYGVFSNTVSMGIVSGNKRSVEIPEEFTRSLKMKLYSNLLQTDASLNPGNSGGPLINLNKQVIGINVATTWNGSVGFAIPVNNLKNILPAILNGEMIKRASLGITAYPGGNFYKENDVLHSIDGLAVIAIEKESVSEKIGLKIDDIITHIDDIAVNSLNTLDTVLLKYKPGDTVKLTLYRKTDPSKESMDKQILEVILDGK